MALPATPTVLEVTIIRPASGWTTPRVVEAWKERELLYDFVARDVKVRYAQTPFGAFWAFFQSIGMARLHDGITSSSTPMSPVTSI